jgi:acetoin utilization protein AcuB
MKHRKSLVQDFMTAHPVAVAPRLSLFEAYNVMFDNEIRRLPVVEDGELVGIITMSDILSVLPGYADDKDTQTRLELAPRSVREIMSADPVTVAPDDTIQEAAELMLDNQVSGLPVVDNSHVVGIITESDIFRLIVDSWSADE